MKRITLAVILATLAFCGCQKEHPAKIEVRTVELLSTRAPGDNASEYRPVFLFWKTADVVYISTTYREPYCVADNVPEDANAYEVARYNTHYSYPSDFATLLATGYIPHDLEPKTEGGTKRYHELSLPASGNGPGRVDLMAPVVPLTGSLLNPFDKEGPLSFKHLQSRLTFRAICNDGFPTSLYVDNIRIKVAATDLAGGIVWDPNTRTYIASRAGADVTFGHGCADLSGDTLSVGVLRWYSNSLVSGSMDKNDYSDLGGFYILPNRYSITLSIVCRMYPSNLSLSEAEKEAYTKTADNVTVTFLDGGSGIQLGEGESHEITVFFEQDGLEFSGRKVAWEQGGNIVIPVVPD